MSIYGEGHVKVQDLKEWILQLSIESVESVNIVGKCIEIYGACKGLLELQLEGFKKVVNTLCNEDDWRESRNTLAFIL